MLSNERFETPESFSGALAPSYQQAHWQAQTAGDVGSRPALVIASVLGLRRGNDVYDDNAFDAVGQRARNFQRPDAPLGGRTKRLLDLAVALTALIALAPIMLAVAIVIKLRLGGPVLYAHTRVGHCGQMFRCLKFRTMVVNGDEVLSRHLETHPDASVEWQNTQKLQDDPRITPFGRLLRLSSLDELPQLFNVIRGDMSCVGPRPVVAAELQRYGQQAAQYLKARPGITGLWQVEGRSTCSYDGRVAMDRNYVENWSFWLDIVILLKTIPAVLRFEQAA